MSNRPTGRRKHERHGMSGTRLYSIWNQMNGRCHCKGHISYPNYGARGITVCARWRHSFLAFMEDMGQRPTAPDGKPMWIERIDNSGNYEPGNCRWATRLEQQNNRRDNHRITVNGRTQTITAWKAELGVGWTTIYNRLKAGLPITWPRQRGRRLCRS